MQKTEKSSLYQTKKSHTSNSASASRLVITLKKNIDIKNLFSKGKYFKSDSISIRVLNNIDTNYSRFLFTTKGIKSKPKRNQLKRKMREHIRVNYLTSLFSNNDIALIASNSSVSFKQLGKEMHTVLSKAKII